MAKKYIYVISYLDGNHLESQEVFLDETEADDHYDAARRTILGNDFGDVPAGEAFEIVWQDYRGEGDYDIYLHRHELKEEEG